jgi:competence protein ComEC
MKKLKLILIALCILFVTSCSNSIDLPKEQKNDMVQEIMSGQMSVSFIDVGQGDSILVKTPNGKNILIDTSTKDEKDKFFSYIEINKIKRIDVLIATHPHEDHIGNMAELISNYDIGDIYMPKVTSNTKTFLNVMDAVRKKGLKIKSARTGVSFETDGVKFEMLSPNKDKYESLNNYSPVIKVKYGEKVFLLTGDAEKLSESEILSKGYDIKADVIKIGHHGSSSSSSKEFIKKVNPVYAVVSCGQGNDYNHPHKETVKLLSSLGIKLYRTDIDGSIVFTTDGKSIKINTFK